MAIGQIIVLGSMLMVLIIIGIIALLYFQWNIPVVVLRYQGDKNRPLFVPTKARKTNKGGVARLYVRGYRIPVRDFKSENYFPFVKGRKGALILWEPKAGLLTPVTPKKRKGMNREDLKKIKEAHARYSSMAVHAGVKGVSFEFNEGLYDELLLNAVDDTDIDFMLQEVLRVNSQYTTGWRDFLSQYGSHVTVVVVAIMLLVGFIVWLDKSPEWIAKCASVAQESSANVFKGFIGDNLVVPPG